MSRRLPIVAVLGLALALRVWGIAFGLPHTLARPDEDAVLSTALRFFSGRLNPEFFDWPSLYMYAVSAAYVVYFHVGRLVGWFSTESSFLQAAAGDATLYILIARGVSLAAGVATVWTVDRLGTRVFDRTTGLVGALFLAVAMLHARDSHFGVTDVAATWLVCMSVLFAVKYLQTGLRVHAFASAMWAGLAVSTKYNAGFVVFPGLWAIATSGGTGDQRWSRRVGLLAAYGGVAVAAFAIGTPYALLDLPRFRAALLDISAHLRAGHFIRSGPAWFIHLSSSLRYGLGWPLLGAGLSGLALSIWKRGKAGVILALFPIVYFGAVGAGQSAFARYIVPVVPFLCVAAAYVAVEAARWIARWSERPAWTTAFVCIIGALIAAPSAWSTVQIDRLLARRDNRLVAADWIRDQFPDGATMYQSGEVYGHVQMQTADARTAARYGEVRFDETALPELLIVPEAPLAYAEVPDAIRRIAAERYQLLRTFTVLDASNPRLVYDRDDAFFVPLAGFDAVERPGPNLTVYRRK